MVEIARCALCEGYACEDEGSEFVALECSDCGARASWKRTREEAISAWNALMQPQASPPPAGTVRVRIPVWRWQGSDRLEAHWQREKDGSQHSRDEGQLGCNRIAIVTAVIPLPQPTEIAGSVEGGE